MLNSSLSRRSLLAGAAAVAGAVTLPAAGASARRRVNLPESITAHAVELYPEGVTWDPTHRTFLVGSARYGSVSRVTAAGEVTELVPSLGFVSTLGVKVDVARNRGVVAYSDFWVRQSLPVSQAPISGVAMFDLTTGEVIRTVDVDPGGERTFGNDLALDEHGNAYVTNSVSTTIVKVTPRGRVTPVITDDRFAAAIVGANGIVYDRRGFLLVARYDTGVLYKIPLAAPQRMSEVTLPRPLIGTDGMALAPNGDLIVVTNSIGANVGVPGGVDAVVVLRSRDAWRTAGTVRRADPWPVAGPTTVAVTPCGAYVMSGEVATLLTGSGVATEFTLRKL